jgi:cytochrome c biogenesis protein CcdA
MDGDNLTPDEERYFDEFINTVRNRLLRPFVIACTLLIALPVLGFSIWKSIFVALIAFVAGALSLGRRVLQYVAVVCVLYSLLVILELAPPVPELKAFLASRISSLSPTCPGPPAN